MSEENLEGDMRWNDYTDPRFVNVLHFMTAVLAMLSGWTIAGLGWGVWGLSGLMVVLTAFVLLTDHRRKTALRALRSTDAETDEGGSDEPPAGN